MSALQKSFILSCFHRWSEWRRGAHCVWLALWLMLLVGQPIPAHAALQFDVFLGYDSKVREASWFPVTCEVFNDGPTFNAVVELSLTAGNGMSSEQVRRVPMEFPTNTRKRFVIPVFATGGRFYQWNARLVDERGKVIAEPPVQQPQFVAWEGILMGALPRSFCRGANLA